MTDFKNVARVVDGTVNEGITVYGAGWCGDTRRSRALLDQIGIPYAYVDVDEDESAAAWVAAHNGGRPRLPTIVVGAGGPILAEPSDPELTAALRDAGLADAA